VPMESFSDRLGQLLAGRKIHPWAAALGVSKGAAETMGRGQVPGAEILRLIRFREGVSLGWLVTGDGAPFVLEHCDDGVGLAQELAAEAGQCAGALELHLFGDGPAQLLLLARPGRLQYRQQCQDYRYVRLWTLALSSLPASLKRQAGQYAWYWHQCDESQLAALRAGQLGPWLLLDSGRLPPPQPLADPLARLRETASPTEGLISTGLMRAVIRLVEATAEEEGLALGAEQRARVYTAVYRHAQRLGLSADALGDAQVRLLLEVLD